MLSPDEMLGKTAVMVLLFYLIIIKPLQLFRPVATYPDSKIEFLITVYTYSSNLGCY